VWHKNLFDAMIEAAKVKQSEKDVAALDLEAQLLQAAALKTPSQADAKANAFTRIRKKRRVTSDADWSAASCAAAAATVQSAALASQQPAAAAAAAASQHAALAAEQRITEVKLKQALDNVRAAEESKNKMVEQQKNREQLLDVILMREEAELTASFRAKEKELRERVEREMQERLTSIGGSERPAQATTSPASIEATDFHKKLDTAKGKVIAGVSQLQAAMSEIVTSHTLKIKIAHGQKKFTKVRHSVKSLLMMHFTCFWLAALSGVGRAKLSLEFRNFKVRCRRC
jgi:hypothetical protein